ncbi:YeiH family protein [Psychrobacillus vulpis]|uniref:YeiH family putative sulfate export transporter n=1 Tax=Psychrobacillus vulpis TaxID=2325572 RepID=A0A544TRM2_9BACI|nr:YeiH family protein [Psychrobacillus vulpis]TQR20093.1 YeiH family putative sulfate export transporter [Psychrobacillus vulpis]
MSQTIGNFLERKNLQSFSAGIGITFIIAIIAKVLVGIPYLSIIGQLVIAILLGMIWSTTIGVPTKLQKGVTFSSKKLLRIGIILLGMRLNLVDIYHAGLNVFLISIINVAFALAVVYGLTLLFGIDKKLGILTACGTAICGAAAIVAIAPQVKAKDEETGVAVATIAILGTLFTLVYTLLYPILDLTAKGYGVFAGGTLHEIAHVIAGASPGGDSAVDLAVIVKLTRVALLVPIALVIGFIVQKGNKSEEKSKFSLSTIPWFILGFLAMSGLNTLGIFSETIANFIVSIAYLLLAMAMAGLGLNIDIQSFKKLGLKTFAAGLIGSILLSGLGYLLVLMFHLNV